MIDEVHQLNPGQPPLKWAVYGFFKPDAPIYNILFYTFDPLTDERKDLIASVEWKMVGSPKEIHYKDGLITFPLLSFRGNRLGQFILKKDPFSMSVVTVAIQNLGASYSTDYFFILAGKKKYSLVTLGDIRSSKIQYAVEALESTIFQLM